MPDIPYTLTETDMDKKIHQMFMMISELYQDRIGGANLGDVFTIGEDDILTLSVTSDGGIEKVGNHLTTKRKSGYGVDCDSDGLKLKRQAHEADASESHTITDPADAPATADALRDDLVANAIPDIESALDALGVKINAILVKLEASEIIADS